MAGAQATIISKGMRFRKLIINPLEPLSSCEYCRFCHDEVDVEIDQGKWGKVFVYRKRCLRCGKTIQWGMAQATLTTPDPAMMKAVSSWMQTAGQDRR